jgi:hypothetical protein
MSAGQPRERGHDLGGQPVVIMEDTAFVRETTRASRRRGWPELWR